MFTTCAFAPQHHPSVYFLCALALTELHAAPTLLSTNMAGIQTVDVAGRTAIEVLPVSAGVAQAEWQVETWRQWRHPGPTFRWHFDRPISMYVLDGVALIRPVGRWSHYRYQVVQGGDMAITPASFTAEWTVHPSITIAWQYGQILLAVPPAGPPAAPTLGDGDGAVLAVQQVEGLPMVGEAPPGFVAPLLAHLATLPTTRGVLEAIPEMAALGAHGYDGVA